MAANVRWPPCLFYPTPICVAWYLWYQSSSVALECLSNEFVECSVLSRTIGRVLENSTECHQRNYDADRCTCITKCHQVYYNVVLNESYRDSMHVNTSMMQLKCHLGYCIYLHCFCKNYNYVKNHFPVTTSMTVSFHLAMSRPSM
jgi:hypothetical protein